MKTNNELILFCKNFKKLRERERLSKRRMSKMLGISIETLRKIENCDLPLRLNCAVLFRIYHCFDISPRIMLTEWL